MASAPKGRLDRASADLVDRAVAHARHDAGDDRARAALVEAMIPHYWRNVPPEDLARRDPVDIQGATVSHLAFGWRRPPGTALVRVISPSEDASGWGCPHSVVEVVTDDMPFLVDSVTSELNRQGFSIHLVVHPQFRVRRNAVGEFEAIAAPEAPPSPEFVPESWIHVEIDRRSDVSTFTGLQRDLRNVLEDVRAAVEDWGRMLARVDDAIAELKAGVPAAAEDDVAETIALLEWLKQDNFTFLGYRDYELIGSGDDAELRSVPSTGLGILRDSGLQPMSRSLLESRPRLVARRSNRRC